MSNNVDEEVMVEEIVVASRGSGQIRGTGKSGTAKGSRNVRMRDWMDQDVPDMAAWTAARYPGLPRFAIGHSVGGHALALASGVEG